MQICVKGVLKIANEARIKNHIQKYREIMDITQEQLANELKITRWYLCRLEEQSFSPTPELMIKICRFFGKELSEVFYIDDEV